ncbi:MAG: DUF4038 domain-containing protein [Planctomycetota bacterium]|nr:DUF4038 domain-containing protein [Planctomycetota bacterium]
MGSRQWNKGIALLTSCAAWLGGTEAVADLPPLEVSDDGRFLQTVQGEPFFWMADTAWRIFRLNPDELELYLSNRVGKGFNVIQGPLLLSDWENHAGQTNGTPHNPNETWFAYIDHIIERAEAHDLYVVPVLARGGQASRFTVQSAYDYGYYIGARYRDETHIAAFIVAAEYNYPDDNVQIWSNVAEGLVDGLADQHRLVTIHPRWYGGYFGQTSSHHFHDSPWLDFNMIQSSQYGDCSNDPDHPKYLGSHNWMLVEHDYALQPIKPVLDAEASYEQIKAGHDSCDYQQGRWDAFGVRRRAYWSVFAGGFGHSYGANGVFQFNKDYDEVDDWDPLDYWDVAIDYPGAAQMGHLRDLMESRPFFSRLPGQDIIACALDDDVPTHIHATRDADGRYAFIYVPQTQRDVAVDMDYICGSTANAWWYNPMDGEATFIGAFTADDYEPDGSLEFTTPSGGEDWVLVVDDAGQDFPEPGGDLNEEPNGDINGDGVVNVVDLLTLLGAWGPCPDPPADCAADLDGDGAVGSEDLLILLGNWG